MTGTATLYQKEEGTEKDAIKAQKKESQLFKSKKAVYQLN